MKLYVSCFISFILGGIVFAYFTFNYSIKHFSNFNAHGRYVSYILQGTDSIKIIENIQNENFDEAFFLLESKIDSAKTLLIMKKRQLKATNKVKNYRSFHSLGRAKSACPF